MARQLLFNKVIDDQSLQSAPFNVARIHVFGDRDSGKSVFIESLCTHYGITNSQTSSSSNGKTYAARGVVNLRSSREESNQSESSLSKGGLPNLAPTIKIHSMKVMQDVWINIGPSQGDDTDYPLDYTTEHALRITSSILEQEIKKATEKNLNVGLNGNTLHVADPSGQAHAIPNQAQLRQRIFPGGVRMSEHSDTTTGTLREGFVLDTTGKVSMIHGHGGTVTALNFPGPKKGTFTSQLALDTIGQSDSEEIGVALSPDKGSDGKKGSLFGAGSLPVSITEAVEFNRRREEEMHLKKQTTILRKQAFVEFSNPRIRSQLRDRHAVAYSRLRDVYMMTNVGKANRAQKAVLNESQTEMNKLFSPKASLHLFSTKREFYEDACNYMLKNPKPLTLNFWEYSDDFSGDSIFTGLYGKFLSDSRSFSTGVSIICFDMVRFIRNPKKTLKNLAYYIKLALSQVRYHNEKPQKLSVIASELEESEMRIILVGMGLEELDGMEEVLKIGKEIQAWVGELCVTSTIVTPSDNSFMFFPVDNNSGYGYDAVRVVLSKAHDIEFRNVPLEEEYDLPLIVRLKEVRLKELALLDILKSDMVDSNGKVKVISLAEVETWGEVLGLNKLEVQNALEHFHAAGLIFYFGSNEVMKRYVICDVHGYLDALSACFDVSKLNQAAKVLGFAKPDDFVDFGEASPGYETINKLLMNFQVTKSMLKNVVTRHSFNFDLIIELLKESMVLTRWSQEMEFGAKDDHYFVGPFLNTAPLVISNDLAPQTSSNLRELMGRRRVLDEKEFMELQSEAEERQYYEVIFGCDDAQFPSSMFSTTVLWLIQYMEGALDSPKHMKKGQFPHFKLDVLNKIGLPVVKFEIGRRLMFFIKPVRNGLSLRVPMSHKESTLVAMTLVHHAIFTVNKDVLKLSLRFGIFLNMDGKLTLINKLVPKGQNIAHVFGQWIGSDSMLKVRKVPEDFEKYFL